MVWVGTGGVSGRLVIFHVSGSTRGPLVTGVPTGHDTHVRCQMSAECK